MSASDSSSECITVGQRYEDLDKTDWESVETVVTDNEKHEEEVTEGGLRAWLTVLGSMLIYFAPFGIINSFGFFQNYYENNFLKGVPASTISLIGTTQIMLGNVLAGPAGVLFDCYGLKSLYITSGLACTISLLSLSFIRPGVGSLWQIFLVQGALLGIANAFGTQPALAVIGHHFVRHRALVMGILAAAGSVGGVCFPVVFTKLADPNHIGFAWSLRVVAGITAVCYTIAILISSTNMPRQPLKSLKGLVDLKGFLDRRYSVLAAGAFIAMLGQFVPYYYISTYMQATNPSSPAKDYLLPLMNASSILGRIMGGFAADTAGPTNAAYPMTILSGLLCLGTWAVTSSVPVLLAFVTLYGFCSGVFIAVLPAIIAQITPQALLGARIGAFYSVVAVAQLVGSPIAGLLISKGNVRAGGMEDKYMGLVMFTGSTLLAGGIVIFISRILYDRNLRTRY